MVKFLKNMAQFSCFVLILVWASGCARKEQVKVAAGGEASASTTEGVKADAGAEITEHGGEKDNGTAKETPPAQPAPPPPPPAPQQTPPSEQPVELYAVVNGLDVTVLVGAVFAAKKEEMLFLYSRDAASDCGNVQVTGLLTNSRAGICQIAFLPLEQGFKPGQEGEASVTITPRRDGAQVKTWSFRVKAD